MFAKPKPHPQTCPRCPHRYSEVGCPFYLTGEEGLLENNAMGESRLVKGCIWHEGHLMRWISHMVGAANKPAAVMESWRDDMCEKFEQFGQRVTFAAVMDALGPIPDGVKAIQLIPPNRPNNTGGLVGLREQEQTTGGIRAKQDAEDG